MGKAMTEFRRASNELKSTWRREMADIERESSSIKETTRKLTQEITSDFERDDPYSGYDYDYEQDYGGYSSPDSQANSATKDSSTVGASATQGAESTANDSSPGKAPEGTVANNAGSAPAAGGKSSESKAVTT